jgi:hypothetical protein
MIEKSEAPAFKTGDEISIMRGKHRNATATVLDYSTATAEYAVKFPDGSLGVINAVNVRVPDEATITASQLAQAFGSDASDVDGEVWERLEALVPGITDHVQVVSV